MTAAFAAIETRANAAVMRKLANATATVGATDFPVIFDNAFQQTDVMVGATVPTATFLDANAAGIVSGQTQLTIKGVTYTAIDLQPDGLGFTVLVLQRAP